jgi:hypothetical protein
MGIADGDADLDVVAGEPISVEDAEDAAGDMVGEEEV